MLNVFLIFRMPGNWPWIIFIKPTTSQNSLVECAQHLVRLELSFFINFNALSKNFCFEKLKKLNFKKKNFQGACVLGINTPPVTIKNVENSIIDHGFEMGWVLPIIPTNRTGKKIAVIGSGPSGLAAAAQLNKVSLIRSQYSL